MQRSPAAALYPGSFDPPHLGHVDIIRRAAAIFPSLVVAIAANPEKQPFAPTARRLDWLRAIAADLPGVEIATYAGATVTFARGRGIGVLVRGVRNGADLEAEHAMAAINRSHGVDTVFLPAAPEHAHLSSRLVRMVLAAGLPVDALVPAAVGAGLVQA